MEEIDANLKTGMERVRGLLHEVVQIDLEHEH